MKSNAAKTDGKPIEEHIGRRLRLRRLERGLTLDAMDALIGGRKGKTNAFEEGRRFVGPDDLFTLAAALEVNVSFFFLEAGKGHRKINSLAYSADAINGTQRLIKAYYNISDRTVRRHVVDLVKDIAEHQKTSDS